MPASDGVPHGRDRFGQAWQTASGLELLVLTVLLLGSGCGPTRSGPPEIVVDRTACSQCGMLLSEPIYAAAYRPAGSDARVFDDIGCLLASAGLEMAADLRFWFHDASTGEWIDGNDAVFVASSTIRTPMSGGLIAYRDRRAAEAAAGHHRGAIVPSLRALLDRKEGRR